MDALELYPPKNVPHNHPLGKLLNPEHFHEGQMKCFRTSKKDSQGSSWLCSQSGV